MKSEKTMCALPWVNLNTTPLGQCKLCCNISDFKVLYAPVSEKLGRKKRALGWGRDHIGDIWNGPYMRDIRANMLDGSPIEDCRICYSLEQIGNDSPRLAANRQYQESLDHERTTTSAALPISLELRLSTRCNLRCATCWSGSSDTMAEHRQNMLSNGHMPEWLRIEWDNDLSINLRGEQNFDSDANYAGTDISVDNFRILAPGLRRLYVTGGEPTMDSNFNRYLDELIGIGNEDCHISFTTNCTLWNPKLMERLARFNATEIQISIDGIGETNDWIRRPSQWSVILQNLERYMSHGAVKDIKIFTVISALNIGDLVDVLAYLGRLCKRLDRSCTWYPIMLTNPHWMSIAACKEAFLRSIAADLVNWATHDSHTRFDTIGGVATVVNSLISSMHDEAAAAKLLSWLEFDKKDVGDWKQVLPTLHTMISGEK